MTQISDHQPQAPGTSAAGGSASGTLPVFVSAAAREGRSVGGAVVAMVGLGVVAVMML